LDIVEMVLLDLPASFELISEHRRTHAAHQALPLTQIRQFLHSGRWTLPSRRLDRPARTAAEDVTQDLTQDVAARHLLLAGTGLPSGHRYLNRTTADDDGLYAPLPDPFLEFPQDMAQ
jgi:hypothetical protein